MVQTSSSVGFLSISIYKFYRILNENFFSILFGKNASLMLLLKQKRKIIHFEKISLKRSDLLLTEQNETLKISGQSFCS